MTKRSRTGTGAGRVAREQHGADGDRDGASRTADERRPARPDEPTRLGPDVEEEPTDPEDGDPGGVDADRQPQRTTREPCGREQESEQHQPEEWHQVDRRDDASEKGLRLREPRPHVHRTVETHAAEPVEARVDDRDGDDAGHAPGVPHEPAKKDAAEERLLAHADEERGHETEERLPDGLRRRVAELEPDPAEEQRDAEPDGETAGSDAEPRPELPR